MSKRDPSTAFICQQTPNDILSYCAAFLEKTSDGVLLIDEDGQIIFWNRAMETIFAIKSSEALGVKAWDIHTLLANKSFENEDIIDKIRTDITRALHSGEANWMKGTLEQEIIDRNSQQRYVQFSFFPIETARGFMIGCIARDISEEHRMREQLKNSREQLQSILDNANEIIYTLSPEGIFTYCSPGWTRIQGHEVEEVEGHHFEEFVHPDYIEYCWQAINLIFSTGNPMRDVEYLIKYKDGSWGWNVSSAAPINNNKGETSYIIGIATNITERKAMESALRESESRLRLIQDNMTDIVLQADLEGRYLYASPSHERLLGYPGKPGASMFEYMHPEDHAKVREAIKQGLESLETVSVEFRQYQLTTGKYIWLEALGSVLIDSHGNPYRLQAVSRDITARHCYEEKLKYLSKHDALTGLYNRAGFEEELKRLEGGRFDPIGIVICDCDGLKLVNDKCGHQQGDKLLISIAEILKKCFRETDIIARVGGDEFAILCPLCSSHDLIACVNRLEGLVQEHNQSSIQVPLCLSSGYAGRHNSGIKLEEIMRQADVNMYKQKTANRPAFRNTFQKAGLLNN